MSSSSQTQKQQQKRQKKLEPFFDSKLKTSARWKPLYQYCQKAPPDEVHKFFNEHFFQVYGVFLDTFTMYEANCRKGKHSSSEIQELLSILNSVLVHLNELIRKKWQTRSIASILEKVLYKENKANIRLVGFQLLLSFLEALQNPEPQHLDMFASSIDLSPLTTGYRNVQLRHKALSAPDKSSVLAPSSTPSTAEHAVKLWGILLAHMSQKPSAFEFWFGMLKSQYLPTFYPDVCQRLKIISDTPLGFRPYCPPQIHETFVTHLDTWMKDESIATVLWSSEENVQIMLEVYRQSCRMPIQYTESIKKSINVFKLLFWSRNVLAPVQARLVEFRRVFLHELSGIFTIDSPPNLAAQHINLCQEVLFLFRQIFVEMYESLHKETQETLMYTVLNTTTTLLKDRKNQTLADNLSSTMVDTVLFMWIRTKTRQDELWNALKDGLGSVFNFQVPVVQSKVKLMQLTGLIRDTMYPKKQRRTGQRKPNQDGEDSKKSPEIKSPDSLPSLPPIDKDPNIANIEWSTNDLLFVWKKVLSIFDNVNFIKDSQVHAIGMSCLTDTVDVLLRAEEEIPYDKIENRAKPDPLCLIDIFGPWLFEAASLPETYLKGKSLAVGMLCRLVVRHHGPPLPVDIYANFYAAVYGCLKDHPNSTVSWEILKTSNSIFSLSLPGASVLVPHFLAEAKRVLSASSSAPREVKTKAILVVSSLICYPHHFGPLKIPAEPMKAGRAGAKPVAFDELKQELRAILIETLTFDPDSEHKIMCTWALSVVVFEELEHGKDMAAVKETVKHIAPFCMFEQTMVSRAALDGISALALVYEKIRTLDESIIHSIIEMLCANIHKLILESQQQKNSNLKEDLVADHFYCLLDWIMGSTNYIFDNRNLATKVFGAVERGLLGQMLGDSGSGVVTPMAYPSSERAEPLSGKDKRKAKDNKRMSVMIDHSNTAQSLIGELWSNPSHGSDTVKEAAQILLIQMNNFLNNFPCREGIEVISSQISETDDIDDTSPSPLYYIYNDFALLSLVEIPLPDGSGKHSRIILRDCTGKYAWDSRIVYKNPEEDLDDAVDLLRLEMAENFPQPEDDRVPVSESQRKEGETPTFLEGDGPPVDQVDELLKYLSESFPDCLPEESIPLDTPRKPKSDTHATYVENTQKALALQAEEDERVLAKRIETAPSPDFWTVKPPLPPPPQGSYHNCRLFLSHLGFLSFDKQSSFAMVEDSNRFHRSVAQLDKTSGREMLKIGLIYVMNGQDDQKIIFRNDKKSPLYAEFVRGLGWPIDIKSHRGYLGGLDPYLTTGDTAPYYANSIMEVIFHEITYMPTNPNDAQQITKKRHVGNDIVHIIYSEHVNDYNPYTVTTHFNDAHIIVYPLPNGLFRIQVYRKENVQLFGPLLHGMCVNKELLPLLVRQTAINANRYVRYNTGGYCRPFPTRRRALDEIVERFKVCRPYEELVGQIITVAPSSNTSESS